jgi:outer membrane immunogenic protein
MKNFLALGVALALLAAAGAARAQPPAPVYSWTGFYIGLDSGGAWARQSVSDVACSTCNTIPESGTLTGSAFIGGFYAGYNFMIAPTWLVGIEGDWSWTRLSDATTAPQITPAGAVGNPPAINAWSGDTKWLASLRGRVGITPFPTTLLYVTGGVAWNRTDYSAQDIFGPLGCANGNCALTSLSQTKSGYVIGAGADWAPWSNNWLLRAEYLYYGFSGATSTVTLVGFPTLPVTFNWGNLSIQELRFGAAYKF